MTFRQFQRQLGSRLLTLRQRQAMTQEQVARAAGLTRQHLQRLEAGGVNAKMDTLFGLARVFKMPVSKLIEP